MNESELNEIVEAAWRRPLTGAERAAVEAWARSHAEQRAELEAVLAISQSLQELPTPAVPSNFMSRIWQEVDADQRLEAGKSRAGVAGVGSGWWRAWWPRLGVGLAAVAITAGGWWRFEVGQRAVLVTGITAAANVTEPLDPAMLREFEAIKILGEAPASVDVELLAALQ